MGGAHSAPRLAGDIEDRARPIQSDTARRVTRGYAGQAGGHWARNRNVSSFAAAIARRSKESLSLLKKYGGYGASERFKQFGKEEIKLPAYGCCLSARENLNCFARLVKGEPRPTVSSFPDACLKRKVLEG